GLRRLGRRVKGSLASAGGPADMAPWSAGWRLRRGRHVSKLERYAKFRLLEGLRKWRQILKEVSCGPLSTEERIRWSISIQPLEVWCWGFRRGSRIANRC